MAKFSQCISAIGIKGKQDSRFETERRNIVCHTSTSYIFVQIYQLARQISYLYSYHCIFGFATLCFIAPSWPLNSDALLSRS